MLCFLNETLFFPLLLCFYLTQGGFEGSNNYLEVRNMSFKKVFHFPNSQSIHSSTIMLTNFKTTVFAGRPMNMHCFF